MKEKKKGLNRRKFLFCHFGIFCLMFVWLRFSSFWFFCLMLFSHVFPFFFPILVLLFFLAIFFCFFFVNFPFFFQIWIFFFSFELSIIRVSCHYIFPPPSSGLGTSKISLECTDLSWRSCRYSDSGGKCSLKSQFKDSVAFRVPWFTEETRLNEWVNNIIGNFLDVDSVVAKVVFTICFFVSFFHVEAKSLLK